MKGKHRKNKKVSLLNPDDENIPGTTIEFTYKYEYHVSGMHCPACELLVEKKIEKLTIIKNVNAVLNDNKVYLETKTEIGKDELLSHINALVKPIGYEVNHTRIRHKVNFKELAIGFGIAAAILGIFLLMQKLGIAKVLGGKSTSLSLVFLMAAYIISQCKNYWLFHFRGCYRSCWNSI